MKRQNIILLVPLFLFFLFPSKSFASEVVINEFLVDPDNAQWVELYNKSDITVDLSGWFIDDDGGSQKYTIPDGETLNAKEFKTYENSLFNFNRASADTVRLLNKNLDVIDSYSYTEGLGENKSFGRKVDG